MPNPSTYFDGGGFEALAPTACVPDTTPPTFAGITGLSQNLDGSLAVSWSAATDSSPPVRYEVYVQAATATGLFATANIQQIVNGLSSRVFTDPSGLILQVGQNYFVGVRSLDFLGNRETNTASISHTISSINYSTLAGAVWDQPTSGHTIVGTFGTMVEEIDADVDEIISTLGMPAGASIAADIAEIEGETDFIIDTLGTPSGASVSADIAEIAAETDLIPAIKAKTDNLPVDPASNTQVNTRVSTAHFDTVIGIPANGSVSADIAEVEADVDLIPTNPQLATVALTQYNTLISALNNLQNNTNFSGIVPEIMDIPQVGTETYTFYAAVFDSSGNPKDPDSNILNFTVKDNQGNTLQAQTAMTRDGIGQYHGTFQTNSGMVDTDVVVFFNYLVASVAIQQIRTSKITTIVSDSANIVDIKAKTDQLSFTAGNVNAQSNVVVDKTGYSITVAEHTQIAADVWDSLISAHNTAGTFGANAQTPAINPSQVAAAVWDALTSGYAIGGSFGALVGGITPSFVAAAVWNALLSSYNIAGTFGGNAQSPPLTPTQIASSVWNALLLDYDLSGSFGEAIAKCSDNSPLPPTIMAQVQDAFDVNPVSNADFQVTAVVTSVVDLKPC